MCGRTCMTLNPSELKHACKYKGNDDDKKQVPEYRNENNIGRVYSEFINTINIIRLLSGLGVFFITNQFLCSS